MALSYVFHTILPETTRFTKNDNGSAIYKAKLHNPIENIVKIAANVNCQRMNGFIMGLEIL